MRRKRRARKNTGKAVGKTNRGRRFPPEVLTADEVGHLMDACSRKSVTGIRNRVLIATLYRAGLRISVTSVSAGRTHTTACAMARGSHPAFGGVV